MQKLLGGYKANAVDEPEQYPEEEEEEEGDLIRRRRRQQQKKMGEKYTKTGSKQGGKAETNLVLRSR